MSPDQVRSFQAQLADVLGDLFGPDQVAREWTSLRGEDGVYTPRLDVAVGPFATGATRHESSYDALASAHRSLIERLYECHCQNVRGLCPGDHLPSLSTILSRNPNARCFMAIEIENECSRKHILGGLVNAAALGRIGIVVAWTPEKLRAVLKMRRYLLFLASVGKNTFDPANLLVLWREQVARALAAGGVDETPPLGVLVQPSPIRRR